MKNEKGFVGYFEVEDTTVFKKNNEVVSLSPLPANFAFTKNNFLDQNEIEFFEHLISEQVNVPVGVTGYYHEYNSGDKIGSYRGTIYTENIAHDLFQRLKGAYPEDRIFTDSLNSDHDEHSSWEFVGINPLFRFIKYKNKGELVPHYDAPFIKNEQERTLVTMVIYLTNNKTGHTRFIKDPQSHLPVSQRDLRDWTINAKEEDVLFAVQPEKGKLALFDHRVIHDCETLDNEEKIIIRTDLMFKKIKG